MKRLPVTVSFWQSHPDYPKGVWVAKFRQAEKRIVRYFDGKKEAARFASKKSVELLNEGRKNGEVTRDEMRAIIESRALNEKLRAVGIQDFSIQAAIKHYSDHLKSLVKSASIENAWKELLALRKAEGKSGAHVRDLQYKLAKFVDDFGTAMMASISPKDIAGWLLDRKCEPQTRLNYRRLISNLFSYGHTRGYCSSNPATNSLKIKVPSKAVGILTVPQLTRLLQHSDRAITPTIAIGAFAGLRREEICRLSWSDVNLSRGYIEVTAQKSKTAQRRLVTISENLKKWLSPHASMTGPVRCSEALFNTHLKTATTAAKIITWPHNALRHSFASYHLAMYSDAAKTALELGHTESATLFRHYRELVHPEDAKKYWAILPT